MKSSPTTIQTLLSILSVLWAHSLAADFNAYLPSRTTNQLWIVHATEKGDELSLTVDEKVDLGFVPATIVAHPEEPLLYVSTNVGDEGNSPAAIITLEADGSYKNHTPLTLDHGYAYLSLDRDQRFLLGADYRGGHIDVYALDEQGKPGSRVAFLDEGRNAAHAVLTSPDSRFVYIPYVKDSNAILQYAFDSDTGALTPLEPHNANPPKGTGPRHIAYHPKLPLVYFSNEQGLGASVYERNRTSGQLTLKQVIDVIPSDQGPEKGTSASDCAISQDGKFLFTGQRSGNEATLPNGINRYRVNDDGSLKHLGLTPTGEIPWGFAFSPDGQVLLVTAFKSGILHAFHITEQGDLKPAATLPIDKSISDLVTR
ncbi:lactonase family protein [Opitutia bacterium ISCC 51]|nr:lactonase family protein [Opitutae bacterium ISCC 51]QXD28922.1 lactonase family protein [Opitutae bacterium ISCC 52]